MQGEIADQESLAVFVFDSNKMKAVHVHWRAFLPDRRGERSFFRIDGLSNAQITAIGRTQAGDDRNQVLHGWGQLRAAAVRAKPPLTLRADEPPDRHGVIEGWPTELEQRNELALALSTSAAKVEPETCQ
jgi:hypothetical protein